MPAASRPVILAGFALVLAALTLALTQARLGTPLFFALAATLGACQIAALALVGRAPNDRRAVVLALGFAVAARIPLAVGPVYHDSDMIRYIWDGRVQRFGYNPYAVVPSDPALAHTHTADTVRMPSRHARTPYPPAAQLFFRLLVTLYESARLMKVVLVGCDLLTILLLWKWLRAAGRDEWLVLAYAWNPLVILEVAHSGHIDALGAFWIAASAYWLTARRTALASLAFTMAVATKLLPVVLAPLFIARVRARDVALAAGLLAALYLPFMSGGAPPLGAVPNVVAHIRFNSPVFRPLAWVVTPTGAAGFALAVALALAAWARWRLDPSDPAAWAWPMAVALACAPVIYPWYLLYFTPFLFTRATLPLSIWTFTIIPVYLVWERARLGEPWRVPDALMAVEYGVVLLALAVVLSRRWISGRPPAQAPSGARVS